MQSKASPSSSSSIPNQFQRMMRLMNQDVGVLLKHLDQCLEEEDQKNLSVTVKDWEKALLQIRHRAGERAAQLTKEATLNQQVASDCREELEQMDHQIHEYKLLVDEKGWHASAYSELERLYQVRQTLVTELNSSDELSKEFAKIANRYSRLMMMIQTILSQVQQWSNADTLRAEAMYQEFHSQLQQLEEDTRRLNQLYLGTMDPNAPLLMGT